MKNNFKIAFACALIIFQGACALGPVETDPEKAAQRWELMRQDCYARGGVWNDNTHTCLAAGKGY